MIGMAVALSACEAGSSMTRSTTPLSVRISTTEAKIIPGFLRLPQFSIQVSDIGDSEKRLIALQQGQIDVTAAVADITYQAFNGQLPNHSRPLDNIRGIALLHTAAVHLLIGPKINSRRGFRGMRVVLGNPVGGNAALGERLLDSMGISKSAIEGEYLSRDLAVEKLLTGDVDAIFITGGPPQEPVVRALRGGAHLLDIEGSEIDRLRLYYPLLRRMGFREGLTRGSWFPCTQLGLICF